MPRGGWPEAAAVERFLEDDRLARVLALYGRAMRLDPDEPAFPWNLASTLERLGQHHLTYAFLARAVRVAERVGDAEWSGGDALLSVAELALAAGDTEGSVVALAGARQRGGVAEGDLETIADIIRASDDPAPDAMLARLLAAP